MHHAASHSLSYGSSSAMDCLTSKSTDDEGLPADPDESSASVKSLVEKYANKPTGLRLKKANRPIRGRLESSTADLHKSVYYQIKFTKMLLDYCIHFSTYSTSADVMCNTQTDYTIYEMI